MQNGTFGPGLGQMDNLFGPLHVVKNWKPGDTREVLARDLDRLHGTAAYDSYTRLYRIDGRSWLREGHISRADGETLCILRCVDE